MKCDLTLLTALQHDKIETFSTPILTKLEPKERESGFVSFVSTCLLTSDLDEEPLCSVLHH